jgi:hypothetical protein
LLHFGQGGEASAPARLIVFSDAAAAGDGRARPLTVALLRSFVGGALRVAIVAWPSGRERRRTADTAAPAKQRIGTMYCRTWVSPYQTVGNSECPGLPGGTITGAGPLATLWKYR